MHDVVVVGAGFGGIAATIELQRAGFDDVVVLERADDVGGTWLANTYPGCQCDVPSNLYSFSFARKSDWTHSYPEQPQILDYLRDTARRYGVTEKVRLETEMLEAAWSDEERAWSVRTSRGELSARALVPAPGLLSEPRTPDLPGLDRFAGEVFHSARWNHSQDLAGKRVAVIGTGASAVQLVPRIQPRAGQLYVLQRTPPWVLPHTDREIGELTKRLYSSVPVLQRASRTGVYWVREGLALALLHSPLLRSALASHARSHLRRQVRDPELRRRLTPSYTVGCKRVVLSNDWYPALQAPNAEVISDALVEVGERSLRFADGSEREIDVLVLATGFSPTDPPIARRVRARGQLLTDAWHDSMRAYLGTAVAGFPNMFLLWGPNTNLAHSSVVFMIESQTRYLAQALTAMRERGATTLEVRREVQDKWNAWLQERLGRSVWNSGGCASWYLDRNGDNPIMWPDFTFSFRRRTRRFDPSDYRFESTPADAPAEPAVAA